jgi:hypothetical protein
LSLVVRTFTGNVWKRVRFAIERPFIRLGVAKSMSEFTIVELSIDEFKESGTILRVGRDS